MTNNWQHYAILDRLRAVRCDQGITIAELARRSGINATTIDMHERAVALQERDGHVYRIHYASERVAKALAKGLEVELEEIGQRNPEFYENLRYSLQKKIEKVEGQIANARENIHLWQQQRQKKIKELDALLEEKDLVFKEESSA